MVKTYMSELRYGNVTAVSCVNNMGDISQTCNNVAYRIWNFCAKTNSVLHQEQSILKQICNLEH